MRYAQFFHNSTGWNGTDFSGPVRLIEACGSDSVAVLDGRLSLASCEREAAIIARKRKFLAFRIMAGRSYTFSNPVTPLKTV